MIEPITGITIDDTGTFRGHFGVRGSPRGIILIQEAYNSEQCQKSIAALVRNLAKVGGVKLVCIEVDQHTIPTRVAHALSLLNTAGDKGFGALMRVAVQVGLPTGILLPILLNDIPSSCVVGIDATLLADGQQRMRARTLASFEVRNALVAQLVAAARDVRRRVYSEPLQQVSNLLYSCYGLDTDANANLRTMLDYARLNKFDVRRYRTINAMMGKSEMVARAGMDSVKSAQLSFIAAMVETLSEIWPSCDKDAFRQILSLSETLNFSRAEIEQAGIGSGEMDRAISGGESKRGPELISRLFENRVLGTSTERHTPTLIGDERVANRLIRIWADETGVRHDEGVNTSEVPNPCDFREAACWLQSRLMTRAADYALGRRSMSEYYRELFLLAIGLGVKTRNSRCFREFISHSTTADVADCASLVTEAKELARRILRAAAKTDQLVDKLVDAEECIDLLHKAICLELPMDSPLHRTVSRDLYSEAVRRLGELGSTASFSGSGELFEAQKEAAEFHSISRQRGRVMIENTVAEMKRRMVDRAVLIVGGFHVDVIRDNLEKTEFSEVEWSVLLPRIFPRKAVAP